MCNCVSVCVAAGGGDERSWRGRDLRGRVCSGKREQNSLWE